MRSGGGLGLGVGRRRSCQLCRPAATVVTGSLRTSHAPSKRLTTALQCRKRLCTGGGHRCRGRWPSLAHPVCGVLRAHLPAVTWIPPRGLGELKLDKPMDTQGILESSIAGAAAMFSGWAAWSARQAARTSDRNSQRANQISESASRTAEAARATADAVARIEEDRFHRELTPDMTVQILLHDQGVPLHYLKIDWRGPTALRRLDSVSISIRDDKDRTASPVLGDGRDVEERNRIIWGPLRFPPRTDNADELGRHLGTFAMELHDTREFRLEHSARPSWYEGAEGEERWRRQYSGSPLRLWITCMSGSHRPWTLSAEVDRVMLRPVQIGGPGR